MQKSLAPEKEATERKTNYDTETKIVRAADSIR
jgi:hypothetical protein